MVGLAGDRTATIMGDQVSKAVSTTVARDNKVALTTAVLAKAVVSLAKAVVSPAKAVANPAKAAANPVKAAANPAKAVASPLTISICREFVA
tara:strand:+ start:117 stop:392 length:276 start_codon:yes stop_codon:yes gene_type:complete